MAKGTLFSSVENRILAAESGLFVSEKMLCGRAPCRCYHCTHRNPDVNDFVAGFFKAIPRFASPACDDPPAQREIVETICQFLGRSVSFSVLNIELDLGSSEVERKLFRKLLFRQQILYCCLAFFQADHAVACFTANRPTDSITNLFWPSSSHFPITVVTFDRQSTDLRCQQAGKPFLFGFGQPKNLRSFSSLAKGIPETRH